MYLYLVSWIEFPETKRSHIPVETSYLCGKFVLHSWEIYWDVFGAGISLAWNIIPKDNSENNIWYYIFSGTIHIHIVGKGSNCSRSYKHTPEILTAKTLIFFIHHVPVYYTSFNLSLLLVCCDIFYPNRINFTQIINWIRWHP